jgi:beta-galactosidase GanA
LIEPEEGKFDFATVDRLLAQARENRMHLVLLWFGSWKNSMSCYAPAWIKRDPKRFPRAADLNGARLEILSPFSTENLRVDTEAFSKLLRHLRETDGTQHTAVMVQVENEIGMIPTARDHSPEADRAFAGAVPGELMSYLTANSEHLAPELKATWSAAGGKRSGTWAEIFGKDAAGEEIFMAWYFARYTDAVAAAGKREYPLPMYVNAALIRPGHQPGQYPSAGPLPHLMDVWHAGAPTIDMLSPDIYFQNFVEWARRYKRPGNPLFIPEAMRSPEASVNGLYAYGAYDAIGFSPFGIESIGDPAAKYLAESFGLMAQLEPIILKHQGNGSMAGLLSEGPEQRQPQQVRLGGYVLSATFERGSPPNLADGAIVPTGNSPAATLPPSGGMVIAMGPDEFIFAGTALIVTFTSVEPGVTAGILSAEEGRFVNGEWQNILWLGGDQTHQGRHIRLEPGRFSIQRVKLYHY